jgi:hypothetical protein
LPGFAQAAAAKTIRLMDCFQAASFLILLYIILGSRSDSCTDDVQRSYADAQNILSKFYCGRMAGYCFDSVLWGSSIISGQKWTSVYVQ